MSTTNTIADDRQTRRLNYVNAIKLGRQLANQLQAPELPTNTYQPLAANYYPLYGDLIPGRRQNITTSSNEILRSHNVDTNRLQFCEIYSNNRHEDHVVLTHSDSHSGILRIVELDRGNDETPWGPHRLPMSELVWHTYAEELRRQNRPSSSLRIVWMDTVIEEETKPVV